MSARENKGKKYRVKISAKKWLCMDREAWKEGECLMVFVVSAKSHVDPIDGVQALNASHFYEVMTGIKSELVEA